MQIQQAKQIPLTQVMHRLGFSALYTRKNGNEWWYCSPFREETKPSFKITIDKNTWYDFGAGEGGTILDLLMQFLQTDIRGVLAYLDTVYASYTSVNHAPVSVIPIPPAWSENSNRQIQSFQPLKHQVLCYYLRERGIDATMVCQLSVRQFAAKQAYLGELHYTNNGKSYYAIALKNEQGGYDLRCKGFKGCIGTKAISIIPSETVNETLLIFEGFTDWFSLLMLMKVDNLNGTVLILNSTTLIQQAITHTQQQTYKTIKVCFDNDESGQKAFETLQKALPNHPQLIDQRAKYAAYNDLNALLVARQTGRKKRT